MMMMVPKYPFVVTVWRKVGTHLDQRAKSFETLDAAHSFANSILRSGDVKRVQFSCIFDDIRKNEAGDVLGFDRETHS
jgi:hypothetical protein